MKILKNKNIEEQKVDNELVIFIPENDSIICLDQRATILWELIDQFSEMDDIIEAYYKMFEEKPPLDEFAKDIDDVLSDYVRAGLLLHCINENADV